MLNTRALGLTRPSNPLAGLAEDFTIRQQDLPPAPQREEPGPDLPPEVMRQLCDALPRLDEITSREMRVAIELLIDTSRRPDEVCELAWDCLAWDADSQPLLVYDTGRTSAWAAACPSRGRPTELINGQKKRVRERFPDTPLAELKLLPSAVNNPHGREAISDGGPTGRHRERGQQPATAAAGRRHRVRQIRCRPLRLPAHLRPAARRCRVPADVLRDLMDHQSMDSPRATTESANNAAATRWTRLPPCSSTATATAPGGRPKHCWTPNIPVA